MSSIKKTSKVLMYELLSGRACSRDILLPSVMDTIWIIGYKQFCINKYQNDYNKDFTLKKYSQTLAQELLSHKTSACQWWKFCASLRVGVFSTCFFSKDPIFSRPMLKNQMLSQINVELIMSRLKLVKHVLSSSNFLRINEVNELDKLIT